MAATNSSKGGKTASAPQPFVTAPIRKEATGEHGQLDTLFLNLASRFPDLKKRLFMAEIPLAPHEFVRKSAISAALVTVVLELCLIAILYSQSTELAPAFLISLLGAIIFAFVSFNYLMMGPNLAIIRRGKKIDQEILFAGRHMLIELRSGLTLFDAMLGVSQDYGEVSKEFNRIVEKITLGVPANVALHDVAENSPSQYFRRLVLQISNSLMSGSDLATGMEAVLDQISKEQVIQVKSYGQKLNPIVMFFMLFGVIIPSLGVAFLILLFSFIGTGMADMGGMLLVGVFFVVVIIQALFLSMVEGSRPSFEMV